MPFANSSLVFVLLDAILVHSGKRTFRQQPVLFCSLCITLSYSSLFWLLVRLRVEDDMVNDLVLHIKNINMGLLFAACFSRCYK